MSSQEHDLFPKSTDPEVVAKMAFDKAKMAIYEREGLTRADWSDALRELAREAERRAEKLQKQTKRK